MRHNSKWMAAGYALLGSLATLGGAALMTGARAQQEFPPPPAQGQPGAFPGQGGPGQGRPNGQGFPGMGGMGMMGGFGGGAATVTATDRYVYVLRGNTLYQFDVNGLKLIAQAQIPVERPRVQPGQGGANGGRDF